MTHCIVFEVKRCEMVVREGQQLQQVCWSLDARLPACLVSGVCSCRVWCVLVSCLVCARVVSGLLVSCLVCARVVSGLLVCRRV